MDRRRLDRCPIAAATGSESDPPAPVTGIDGKAYTPKPKSAPTDHDPEPHPDHRVLALRYRR